MPKIYIIPDPSPNAFATGRNPQHSAVAVTEGLLAKLNRDELQGVIAHEFSHIVHRDILFVTMASVILGSVALLSNIFLRSSRFGSGRRYSSGRDNNGQGLIILLAIVLAILAPILVQICILPCRANANTWPTPGRSLTRYPEGLANAGENRRLGAACRSSQQSDSPNVHRQPVCGTQLAIQHSPPVEERIPSCEKWPWLRVSKLRHGVQRSPAGRRDSGFGPADTEPCYSLRKNHPGACRNQLRSMSVSAILSVRPRVAFIPACGIKLKLPPNLKRQSHVSPGAKNTPGKYARIRNSHESHRCHACV
jgi:heat shock protein HtpX